MAGFGRIFASSVVDSYVGAFRNGNINVIRGLLFRGIKANGRFDRRWVNTRTGEVQSVQAGIDPGWNHNTGALASRQRLNRLAGCLDDPGLAGFHRRRGRRGRKPPDLPGEFWEGVMYSFLEPVEYAHEIGLAVCIAAIIYIAVMGYLTRG